MYLVVCLLLDSFVSISRCTMGRDTELITLIKTGSMDGVKKYLSKLRKSGWLRI